MVDSLMQKKPQLKRMPPILCGEQGGTDLPIAHEGAITPTGDPADDVVVMVVVEVVVAVVDGAITPTGVCM